MANISQKTSSYLQGMSDQPDELKRPGQLRDSLNTFPDVTFGLLKRPALDFVRLLDTPTTDGCWGSYYRLTNQGVREEYILQVFRNGRIRVFDAQNGKRMTVDIGGSTADNATLAYAVHTEDKDVQFTTILDTTIINNRTIRPRMTTRSAVNNINGRYYAYIAITQLAYGQSYTLDILRGNNANANQVTFNTPTDGAVATSVENILDGGNSQDGLVKDINDLGGWDVCIRIGNGIYLEDATNFTVSTPELQLFDIIAVSNEDREDPDDNTSAVVSRYASVQTVAQLPLQCRHNMIVKVSNSFAEEDDYYVRFQGDQDRDGEGVWEETVKPGLFDEFRAENMPHRIVRGNFVTDADGDRIFTFNVEEIPWDNREVGDELTNPYPSFIDRNDPDNDTNGRPIERVVFYRNRLCLLAGENIVMSRAGDYFNFWSGSALNVSVADPIDTAASSTYSSLLLDAIVVNSGLVLFSEFQQFILTTDSDLLSPSTVKIQNLATYDFNPQTNPISLGNTIGFFSDAGVNTRMYEMYNIFREGEPDVIEQSKVLNRRLPNGLTEIADSKENGLVMLADKGSQDLWCYRYYNQGNERLQSAWFRWRLNSQCHYHTIIGDNYYAVVSATDFDGATERISLLEMRLDRRFTATDIAGDTFTYRVHLDYASDVDNADLTFNTTGANAGFTTWTNPIPRLENQNMFAFSLDDGGRLQQIEFNGATPRVKGDWTGEDLHVGYNYQMEVDFPRVYLNTDPSKGGVSDTTGSLTVHRIKLSMGPQGVWQTVLQRDGKDDYTQNWESKPMDAYRANAVPFLSEQVNTVPVYSRNYKYELSLRSEHPGPCTLYSMSWEGMYSNLNYRRT